MDKVYPDKHFTFKVNTRRANKQYPHTSEEVNRDLGEVILDAFPETKVDVHNPDVLLNVETARKTYQRILSDDSGTGRYAGRNQWTAQCCFYPAVSTARWQAT